MAAAVAGNPVVAGECAGADEVEDAETVGHRPGLGFINPHQRGVDDELFVHAEVQCDVEGLDEGIAAIGITAVVGLRDAGDEVVDAALACKDSCHGEEEEVAAGDEGVGRTVGRLVLVHDDGGVGEGVVREMTDERDVHLVPFYVAASFVVSVLAGRLSCNGSDVTCHVNFEDVFLAVDEGECHHFPEMFQRPEEAGGRVLSTAKHD